MSQAVPWQQFLTAEILRLLHSHHSKLATASQLNSQLPVSLAYDISGLTWQKYPVSIVTSISVAAGTCLLSWCPETGLVYPLTPRSLHSRGYTRYNIWNIIKKKETNQLEHYKLIFAYL
jgi:hypothetical protein